MLDGDDALARQVLDLVLAVLLPVVNVRVSPHAQRPAGEDDGAHVVVEAGGSDGLLVCLGCAGFLRQDEARADPDGAGAECHGGCEGLAVEQTAGGDDLHGVAHRALLALAQRGDSRDQDGGGHVARVATALAALGADEVRAEVQALLHVLRVADHVHVVDAGLVETVDDVLGRDADGGDEQLGAGVDDDGYELVELALGVVVAVRQDCQYCILLLYDGPFHSLFPSA